MNDTQVMFDALRTAARMLNAALDGAAEPRSQRLMEASIELRDAVEDIAGALDMAGYERKGLSKVLAEFDRTLLHAPVVPLAAAAKKTDPQDVAIATRGTA